MSAHLQRKTQLVSLVDAVQSSKPAFGIPAQETLVTGVAHGSASAVPEQLSRAC